MSECTHSSNVIRITFFLCILEGNKTFSAHWDRKRGNEFTTWRRHVYRRETYRPNNWCLWFFHRNLSCSAESRWPWKFPRCPTSYHYDVDPKRAYTNEKPMRFPTDRHPLSRVLSVGVSFLLSSSTPRTCDNRSFVWTTANFYARKGDVPTAVFAPEKWWRLFLAAKRRIIIKLSNSNIDELRFSDYILWRECMSTIIISSRPFYKCVCMEEFFGALMRQLKILKILE